MEVESDRDTKALPRLALEIMILFWVLLGEGKWPFGDGAGTEHVKLCQ